MKIENTTDTTVNVINSQTNQTEAILPTKFVEITYESTASGGEALGNFQPIKTFNLFVLSNNTNTGYAVLIPGRAITEQEPPQPMKQILDSFELLE
jgi:hypothetical protein